ncbi:MAG: phenylacetate--CoA ligase family protein [Chloroflexi bacterium]|nr:phenylacetate--CoA ligase family protein [Chloroflexota bacterium]
MMNAFIRRQVMKTYQLATGRRVLDCLNELNHTQWLKRDELLSLQRDKLYKLLTYAYHHVPYYRRTFDQVGFQPDDVLADLGSLSKLPLLTKSIIRENFDDMLTTESERRARMSRLTTGGSTGHPLIFMQDVKFRDYVTADTHRHIGWAGWQFGQLHAYIWGANFELSTSQSLRTRLIDWVLNRFLTNAYVLSEESLGAFAARVRRQQPRILYGYASSLYCFAQFVQEKSLDDITFDGIFSSAEVLYPGQRQLIEQTFRCKMFDRYGTRDLGGVACECDAHAGLHASIENNYIEILQDLDSNEPVRPDETGHIIATNLNNYGMPFIRYSIEDMGTWSNVDHCPCGRELPLMNLVQGRHIDMFKTRDGRSVWGGFASPLFGLEGIKQFQVIQKSLDLIVARIVKEGDLDQTQLDTIERTVKVALSDDVEIRFEFPDEILVQDSGKHRYTISEIGE